MKESTERIPKVWGEEIIIANHDTENYAYCGKILILKKDHMCSIHWI
jgi:hypothetical protein